MSKNKKGSAGLYPKYKTMQEVHERLWRMAKPFAKRIAGLSLDELRKLAKFEKFGETMWEYAMEQMEDIAALKRFAEGDDYVFVWKIPGSRYISENGFDISVYDLENMSNEEIEKYRTVETRSLNLRDMARERLAELEN